MGTSLPAHSRKPRVHHRREDTVARIRDLLAIDVNPDDIPDLLGLSRRVTLDALRRSEHAANSEEQRAIYRAMRTALTRVGVHPLLCTTPEQRREALDFLRSVDEQPAGLETSEDDTDDLAVDGRWVKLPSGVRKWVAA